MVLRVHAANSGGDNDYEDEEDVGSEEDGDDCLDCQQESAHLTFRKFCKRDYGKYAFITIPENDKQTAANNKCRINLTAGTVPWQTMPVYLEAENISKGPLRNSYY